MHPPIAKQVPVTRQLHGTTVVDEYAWLRDKTDPDTIAYLEAENRHTQEQTEHLAGLRDQIFGEIKARVQETDLSAPARKGEWWYATRTEEGKQYPTYVRMRDTPDGTEKTLLDVNSLAEGNEYLRVGVFAVSPDHSLAAYSTDTDGSEYYTLRIRDLPTGRDLADEIPNTYYTAAWSTDALNLFYTTVDAAHRPDKVWRHELGTDPAGDTLVFEEPDERFFVQVGTTQDDRYLLIGTGSQTTTGVWYLAADDPTGRFEPVVERVHGVEYTADHQEGRWLVATNSDAIDGKLLSIAVEDPDDVVELIPHEPGRKVSDVVALAGHIVVLGRKDGLTALTVMPAGGGTPTDLEFDEAVYTLRPDRNLEYDTPLFRITYESMVTPRRVTDLDLDTGRRTVVKETPVLGGFDRSDYTSFRTLATAADGTEIPISVVRRADRDPGVPSPLLLYGYGSYEVTVDPHFSIPRISLLDRGAVFAIAHVRGGGEMGKLWYEHGKMQAKPNTFGDFVACAEHLIDEGWTTPELLAARGASAGGLLMGAITNLRPDLFGSVVAEVPFVDVINTMLDETLPLTVIEWEEWGNPKDPEHFSWMHAYAPYENVTDAAYPAMLVTAGLNDPRVAFWEPAKWVARLRARASSRGPLLLKTEMGSGHGGPSGRYDAWRDEAFVLAFLLDRWGLGETEPGAAGT
jgi:oligopeptidase B